MQVKFCNKCGNTWVGDYDVCPQCGSVHVEK